MTPPKHLWSGDWRRESEDAAREAAANEQTTAHHEAVPPPEPPRPREAPTAVHARRAAASGPSEPPHQPPKTGHGARWAAAALVAVVLVGGAIAVGTIAGNSDNGDTGQINTTAAIPSVANDPVKPSKGQSLAAAIYEKVSPAVVSIRTSVGSGTGFLIDGKGTLVTNAHVVDTAKTVTVQFGSDGKTIKGTVTGTDPSVDLAVVKIPTSAVPSGTKPLGLADSRTVNVGDDVIAIGNPFGLDRTETQGIISAIGRDIQAPNHYSISDALQTDAAINPGNSGGPLLNTAGDVIGVNSQIETGGGGSNGNVGIGFAVPSNDVRQVAPALAKGQTVAHPWLGVSVGASEADGTGALIGSITPGGPAAAAGLRVGDVVLSIDGKAIADSSDLVQSVNADRVGQRITIKVKRDGKEVTVTATVGTRPNTPAQTTSSTGGRGGVTPDPSNPNVPSNPSTPSTPGSP